MPIDRRFLAFAFSAEYTPNNVRDAVYGKLYLSYQHGDTSPLFTLRYPSNKTWVEITPYGGMTLFMTDTRQVLRFNGNFKKWEVVYTIPEHDEIPAAFVNEVHSLTADEAAAKSFSLTHAVEKGEELNIICFVEHVNQIAGTDFTASGKSISWSGKELDDITLFEGDTFFIHYKKANS